MRCTFKTLLYAIWVSAFLLFSHLAAFSQEVACRTTCILSNWGNQADPLNHAIYLYHSPADPTLSHGEFTPYQRFLWKDGSGSIDLYKDYAVVTGTVYNQVDTTMKFEVYLKLTDFHSWETWEAKGRSWMAQSPAAYEVAVTEHRFWTYSLIDPSSTLTGKGSLEGVLNLSHAPADLTKGVQIGWGANDKDGDFGLGGWFAAQGTLTVHGTQVLNIDTQGDLNADSGCTGCVTAVAPVDLAAFEVEAQPSTGIELRWTTLSESNNHYFQVERAVDEGVFRPLTRVRGAGTQNSPSYYRFTDEQFYGNVLYYRLKQVDLDGTFTYSQVIQVSTQAFTATYRVYPNPVMHHLSVFALNPTAGRHRFTIYDLKGSMVQQGEIDGSQENQLPVSWLPQGMYQLLIEDPAGRKTIEKIVKM